MQSFVQSQFVEPFRHFRKFFLKLDLRKVQAIFYVSTWLQNKNSLITAMTSSIEHVIQEFEEKQRVCCDLSKSFDSIGHEILLEKL